MAIDSAAKRASVQAYTFGLVRPPPTGSIGRAQRATVVWLFSGLPYDAPTEPTFVRAAFMNGTAVSADGVMGATFLDDVTSVPASAVFLDGFAHDNDGMRYVALWPSSDLVFYNQGIAVRSDGAMIIATAGDVSGYSAGWALTYRGEVLGTVDNPDIFKAGFGLLHTGSLSVSEVS